MNFLGKGSWSSAAGGISGTVTVKKVKLDNVAAIGDQWARIREAVIRRGNGIPRRKITPVFRDIDLPVEFARSPRLRCYKWETV